MVTKSSLLQKSLFRYLLVCGIVVAAVAAHYLLDPWGFYWKVSQEEAALRMELVQTAETYLGTQEGDASHQKILDIYNTHEPLAVGYVVQETDDWCATFVSAMAISCGLTDIIPTECGCQRQIGLFQELGTWEENDAAVPLPGDIIYYDWDSRSLGDCTGWADHVGIVVGTKWPFVKVIEGNKDDAVDYRIVLINDIPSGATGSRITLPCFRENPETDFGRWPNATAQFFIPEWGT